METMEWKFGKRDRAYTAAGPWDNEPDKMQFVDPATGLACLIHRNSFGALCGYVGVPPGHQHHGKDYNDVDVEVHGGLTYADKCGPVDADGNGICHVADPGEPDALWWLGFDCGHCNDISPCMENDFRRDPTWPRAYRDVAYVKAQCAELARQLAA